MSTLNDLLNIVFPRSFLNDSHYIDVGDIKKYTPIVTKHEISVSQIPHHHNRELSTYPQLLYNHIKKAKIEGVWDICNDFSELFSQLIEMYIKKYNPQHSILSFVPPDPMRSRIRGYHIPQRIAHMVEKKCSIPVVDLVYKKFSTPSQASLNKDERKDSLKDVFYINEMVLNNIPPETTIFLIDDITTTGATIKECKHAITQKLNVESTQFTIVSSTLIKVI